MYHGEQEDDFAVEYVDLPAAERRVDWPVVRVRWPGRLSPRVRNRSFVALFVILLLIFVLISGTPGTTLWSGFARQATPTAVPLADAAVQSLVIHTPSVRVQVSGLFYTVVPGPVPSECPQGPAVSADGEVGHFPAWIGGINGPYASVPLQRVRVNSMLNWRGWAVPLTLTVKYNRYWPVILIVGNLTNGPAPKFLASDGKTLSSILIMNALRARTALEPTRKTLSRWETTLFLPGSGCYFFDASWPHGHWQVFFSAGQ